MMQRLDRSRLWFGQDYAVHQVKTDPGNDESGKEGNAN